MVLLEDCYRKLVVVPGPVQRQTLLEILDTSGHDESTPFRTGYLRMFTVIIFCDTFEHHGKAVIKSFIEMLQRVRENQAKPLLVVVRTKSDLRLPFPKSEEVIRFCRKNGFPFFSTSALTGTNVNAAFMTAALMYWKMQPKKKAKRTK